MRVGFFNSYKVWGGGEKWHFEMMERFLNSGSEIKCTLFAPSDGELFKRVSSSYQGVEKYSIHVGKYTYLNPIDQFKMTRTFKDAGLDLLIFNSFVDVRAAAVAAKKAGVKNIVLRVGTPIAPAQKKSYISAFQHGVDRIVGISDEIINIFKTDAPNVVQNIEFFKIENGIDVETIKPQPSENEIYTFGNCSRLTDQKGFPFLIEAVEKLKEISDRPFKVRIAGSGEDKGRIEQLIEEKDLSESIELVGHVEDIGKFYNSLDALAFTSKFEGTARTILEAWAAQLPVISFDISSMKEMVESGSDGFLVRPYDIEEYALKMKELLENKERYEDFGAKGRRKVVENYNKAKQYEKWENYLMSL